MSVQDSESSRFEQTFGLSFYLLLRSIIFFKSETRFSKICAHSERYRNLLAGIFEIPTFYGFIAFSLSRVLDGRCLKRPDTKKTVDLQRCGRRLAVDASLVLCSVCALPPRCRGNKHYFDIRNVLRGICYSSIVHIYIRMPMSRHKPSTCRSRVCDTFGAGCGILHTYIHTYIPGTRFAFGMWLA